MFQRQRANVLPCETKQLSGISKATEAGLMSNRGILQNHSFAIKRALASNDIS